MDKKKYHCRQSLRNGEENGWYQPENQFPLAGISCNIFKNWIPYNFNNGFHQQKEISKIRFHQKE